VSTVDRAPARASSVVAVGAGVVSLAALAVGGAFALVPGVLGLVLVVLAVVGGSRAWLTTGSGFLLLGALFAALASGTALLPLLGAVAAMVGWDVGENGIGLGEQLGRAARTRHAEFTHASASVLVGLVTVVVGYAVFLTSSGGQPLSALVLLLVGAVVLLVALRA